MSNILIRSENEADSSEIHQIITSAFLNDPMSDGREAQIVALMRRDSALTLSLVAEIDGEVVGHISFSKVTINGEFNDWYGLAPVSVVPSHQHKGLGSKLINKGLMLLKSLGGKGCVVLGEPEYYQRFNFKFIPQLILEGVPPKYFMTLLFEGKVPSGHVKYHSAFGV